MISSGQSTDTRRYLYNTIMHTSGCILVLFVAMTSCTHVSKRNSEGGYAKHTVDLHELSKLLESLDSHLEHFQKRTCSVGLQSHNCALADLSSLMRSRAFLSSGDSPGKRSSRVTLEGQGQDKSVIPEDVFEEAKTLQDDIMEQRKVIWRLKTLLQTIRQNEAGASSPNQKRSCQFRLGGHCLTEELDRAATQYYFLRSPDSPGRRRRSTEGTNTGRDVRTQESVRSQSESNILRR